MTIKNILDVTSGQIAIYKAVDDTPAPDRDYKDIYVGKVENVPPELYNKRVLVMAVYDRGIIEIQIK